MESLWNMVHILSQLSGVSNKVLSMRFMAIKSERKLYQVLVSIKINLIQSYNRTFIFLNPIYN